MHMRPALYLLIFTFSFCCIETASAQSKVLAEIDDLTPREHREDGFILASTQTIQIDAIGAKPARERRNWGFNNDEDRDLWPANAWILDAQTRELVWDLQSETTDRARHGLRQFKGSLTLPAGTYEVHYGSFVATSFSFSVRNGVSNVFGKIFGDSKKARYSGHYVDDGAFEDFRITVTGEGSRARSKDVRVAAESFEGSAIMSLRPHTSESDRYGFELDRRADLDILAIGELDRSGQYDYGWIVNLDTGERVWEMEYYDSDHAGGADKNRVVDERISLPAGSYVAYFVADDSHDPDEWNTMPPFDAEFWGLTLWVQDEDARKNVRTFEYEPVPSDLTFISLTGVGDDEMVAEGFSLDRLTDVYVYALGEGVSKNMVDYAWIVDRNTRERVWTMRYRDTEHAGGAKKNRLVSEILRLDAGNYMVYYRSDGSHSYGDWNSSPPAENSYWGISLSTSNASDLDNVGPAQLGYGDNVIAELVRIGDNDRERQNFQLDHDAKVRIIAVGEGDSGEMYDTAWIEDRDTRRTVWEMTYRSSDHAGGARTNRLFDGTIHLDAGDYILLYSSDGSHSYEDWNADPPDDPESWGVTLLLED